MNGAPSGVTATVQPSALSAGVTAALLDLVIGAAVAPGTHTLTVRASGQGVSDATATLALTITPAAQPDFALTLSSGTLQFAQGAQGMVTVDIQRINGFAGAVALTATGLPNGLTVAFNPASVSGASSVATFSAAGGLAAGTYNVTIQARPVSHWTTRRRAPSTCSPVARLSRSRAEHPGTSSTA